MRYLVVFKLVFYHVHAACMTAIRHTNAWPWSILVHALTNMSNSFMEIVRILPSIVNILCSHVSFYRLEAAAMVQYLLNDYTS